MKISNTFTVVEPTDPCCIFDNGMEGMDGVAIYKLGISLVEYNKTTIYLWFIGNCESPYISNHDVLHLDAVLIKASTC